MYKLITIFIMIFLLSSLAFTQSDSLFFSEYIEGTSNNKALEIYNATDAAVDLSNYRLMRANNGATTYGDSLEFPAGKTLAAGDVYVIANPSAADEIQDVSDTTHTITFYNGNDHLALQKNVESTWTVIDVMGVLGEDPGSAWDVAGVTEAMKEYTLLRKSNVDTGITDWASSAGTGKANSQWIVKPQNTFSYLGSHGEYMIKVSFTANTSRIEGLVDTTGGVDIRGQVQEQEWTPFADPMTGIGGDYWTIDLEFPDSKVGQMLLYKYGGLIVDPVSGDTIFGPPPATNQGWEGDLPGAGSDYAGGNNRENFYVPSSDSVMGLDYVGWKDGPFVDDPDTIQVHFRVNMSTYPGFNSNTDKVFLAGSMPDASWGDSHTEMVREGPNSDYFKFTSKVDSVGSTFNANWKFTRGSWDGNEEKFPDNEQYPGGNRSAPGITQDTTIQFKYYNDAIPSGPAGEDTVMVKWTVDLTAARDAKGFNIGDTLIVEWGFLGTAIQEEDTMTNVFLTNLYTATDTAKNVALGENLLYQYYHIARGSRDRELFFDFNDDSGDNLSREKRKLLLTAPAPEVYEIEDTEESESSMRRQPTFRNSEPIENDVTVYWEVDLRPAYYQVLSGDTLIDIQGNDDVINADSIFTWGVWMNGPAVGDWTNPQPGASDWGSGLRGNPLKKMYDDGTNGGDTAADDSVYTLEWFYTSDSTLVKGQVYKFGIYGGDNEAGNDKSFGNNHVANIDDSQSPTTIHTQFGSINPLFYTMWDFDNQTPTAIEEATGIIIRDPNLHANYPNPFNPTTTLTFELPKQMEVELVVFDVLGRKVIELINGVQRQGVHQVIWNGADSRGRPVSSGVYFYRMVTENYERTMKMVLMR